MAQNYTKEGIIAWVNTTEAGREAYMQYNGAAESVEDFLDDEIYVEKFLGLFANGIDYPGDGNWTPSTSSRP